ncbi:hypothetical protein D5047_18920 [Verminephrobacter eiseniae]|nr:hypothetical protein [Verminephrobacter eiseniae]
MAFGCPPPSRPCKLPQHSMERHKPKPPWGTQERGNGAWPRPHGIPLRQRAAPFIAMRQR